MDALMDLGHRLLSANGPLRWPERKVQEQYTGTHGDVLLTQATDFIRLLVANLPDPRGDWRGLDYGVGWGRLASLMTYYGRPDQLDCVDAWASSLELARGCGLRNRLALVSPRLEPDELSANEYDFIYAYSIFTHLPAEAALHNLERLLGACKPGGFVLFTVRDQSFVDYLRATGACDTKVDLLDSEDYWFGNALNADYGDAVLGVRWLRRYLSNFRNDRRLEILGPMPAEPTQIAVKLTRVG